MKNVYIVQPTVLVILKIIFCSDFLESKLTGKDLHLSIETYLRGVEYSSIRVEPRIAGHWLSMKSILTSISDVHVLESYVVHPYLKYKGFVDCVARYQ